jgi:hypothetical protein
MDNNTESLIGLGDSLMELHVSVVKLIGAIQGMAHALDDNEKILDLLPMLDFYNDDLLRNINKMRGPET